MRGRNRRLGQIKEGRANRHDTVLDGCGLAAVCVFFRERLARSGLDTARAAALRLCPEDPITGGEIIADTSAAAAACDDPALSDADSLASGFAGRIGLMAQRYKNGQQPDLDTASLAELFAWCLMRGRPAAAQRPRKCL